MLRFLASAQNMLIVAAIYYKRVACCTLQGTNAHAIMTTIGAASSLVPSHAELQWQRRRLWLAPSVSPLTERAVSSGRDTVMMMCDVGAVHLCYLWDHQVRATRQHCLPSLSLWIKQPTRECEFLAARICNCCIIRDVCKSYL